MCLAYGTVSIDFFHENIFQNKIIYYRFLELLETSFAGASLALLGCVLQKILRNPICDPFLLGVSSGGMFFGSLFYVVPLFLWKIDFSNIKIPLHSFYSFLGCLLSFLILFLLKHNLRNLNDSYSYPLIGILINSFFSALFMILTLFINPSQLTQMHYWFLGNLQEISAFQIFVLIVLSFPSFFYFFKKTDAIKSMTFGDEFSKSMGYNPKKIRFYLIFHVSFVTAIVISFVGAIGFIGTIIPHFFRKYSQISYKKEFFLNLIYGACFLNFSSFISRYFFSPTVLPIGIIVVVLCAPILILMLIHQSKKMKYEF